LIGDAPMLVAARSKRPDQMSDNMLNRVELGRKLGIQTNQRPQSLYDCYSRSNPGRCPCNAGTKSSKVRQ
jgi:hypothetical protein